MLKHGPTGRSPVNGAAMPPAPFTGLWPVAPPFTAGRIGGRRLIREAHPAREGAPLELGVLPGGRPVLKHGPTGRSPVNGAAMPPAPFTGLWPVAPPFTAGRIGGRRLIREAHPAREGAPLELGVLPGGRPVLKHGPTGRSPVNGAAMPPAPFTGLWPVAPPFTAGRIGGRRLIREAHPASGRVSLCSGRGRGNPAPTKVSAVGAGFPRPSLPFWNRFSQWVTSG